MAGCTGQGQGSWLHRSRGRMPMGKNHPCAIAVINVGAHVKYSKSLAAAVCMHKNTDALGQPSQMEHGCICGRGSENGHIISAHHLPPKWVTPSTHSVNHTLRASLSGTLLQTLPDLVTPLKGYSLSLRSCPATRSAPSERFGY